MAAALRRLSQYKSESSGRLEADSIGAKLDHILQVLEALQANETSLSGTVARLEAKVQQQQELLTHVHESAQTSSDWGTPKLKSTDGSMLLNDHPAFSLPGPEPGYDSLDAFKAARSGEGTSHRSGRFCSSPMARRSPKLEPDGERTPRLWPFRQPSGPRPNGTDETQRTDHLVPERSSSVFSTLGTSPSSSPPACMRAHRVGLVVERSRTGGLALLLPWRWRDPSCSLKGCLISSCGSVMLPSHPFLLFWHKVITLCVSYVAVWTPLQAAFDEELAKPYLLWFIINLVVDSIFIIDVWLMFRVAVKVRGTWVYSRKTIFKACVSDRYGGFALDLVAAFPYSLLTPILSDTSPWEDSVAESSSLHASIRALRLLRLLRVVIKLMHNGTEVAQVVSGYSSRFNPQLVRVSQLLLMLVLTCHWAGCLWWLVGTTPRDESYPTGDSWGPDDWMRAQPVSVKYLHAFNWGAGMILGYVPREVFPQEAPEVVVTLICMFVGFFMVMIFISSTTSALQSQDAKSALSQQKLEKVWRYLAYKKVPLELSSRILEYFNYVMTSSVTLSHIPEFKKLPANMQRQLSMELNRNVLQKCALWAMLPWEVVLTLMSTLRPTVFPPNHVVLKEGEKSPGLHFIENGTVAVLKRRSSTAVTADELGDTIGTMGESEYFGESSLLRTLRDMYGKSPSPNDSHTGMAAASIRTVSYCDILVLTTEAFAHVMSSHDEMRDSAERVQAALEQNIRSSNSVGDGKRENGGLCSRVMRRCTMDECPLKLSRGAFLSKQRTWSRRISLRRASKEACPGAAALPANAGA